MKKIKVLAILLAVFMIISNICANVAYAFNSDDYDFWEDLSAADATKLLNSAKDKSGKSFIFVIYRDSCHHSSIGAEMMSSYAKANNMKIYGLEVLDYPDFDTWMDFVTSDMYVMAFPIVIVYNHELRITHSDDYVVDTEQFKALLSKAGLLNALPDGIKYIDENSSALFNDVDTQNKNYSAITGLATKGILSGYEDGSFKPDEPITRAETAAVIARAAGVSGGEKDSVFSDVSNDFWGKEYIMAAADAGIISGMGDGTFAPDENVTYNQIIKMVVCMNGLESIAIEKGGWPNGYSFVAVENGYINHDTYGMLKGSSYGDKTASRGAVAQIVYNSLK